MKLCIKMLDPMEHEIPASSPCALCRKQVVRVCGPEVFLDGSDAVVCRSCAKEKEPALEHLLAIYSHPESRFCESCGGFLPQEERSHGLLCSGCRTPPSPALSLVRPEGDGSS